MKYFFDLLKDSDIDDNYLYEIDLENEQSINLFIAVRPLSLYAIFHSTIL